MHGIFQINDQSIYVSQGVDKIFDTNPNIYMTYAIGIGALFSCIGFVINYPY